MKKAFLTLAVLCTLGMFCACDDKDYSELIIGTWDVQTYRFLSVDYYQDTSWIFDDEIYNVSDTNYIGFDAAEFFADGIMRWHTNENYQAFYGNESITLSWSINEAKLYTERGPDSLGYYKLEYEIKKLSDRDLVIERHDRVIQDFNNYEYTESYALKRRK